MRHYLVNFHMYINIATKLHLTFLLGISWLYSFNFVIFRGGGSSLTNTQFDAKSDEIRTELQSLTEVEAKLDEVLEVLNQSKAGVLNNKHELYVPYSDIGKTGVADNNKILAIHHPVNTKMKQFQYTVSSSYIIGYTYGTILEPCIVSSCIHCTRLLCRGY